MNNCKLHPVCSLLDRRGGSVRLHDFYRVYLGKREGQEIWIVDGQKVVESLYPAFVMGGNDQRYRFNPQDDIWIDDRIGAEEIEYTIAHELIERRLMRERGWSYDRAHSEGGLVAEKRLRERDRRQSERREAQASPVLPGEFEDTIAGAPVPLSGVYRQLFRTVGGVKVWIVDGSVVRRDIHPDFCFGGHDRKYRFVPAGEIWLDAAMSAGECHFALVHELSERKLMAEGHAYDDAYAGALVAQLDERKRQKALAARHEARLADVPYGVRERGTGPRSRRKRSGRR